MSDLVILRRESIVTIIRGESSSPVIEQIAAAPVIIQRDGLRGARGERGPAGTVGEPFVYTPPDVATQWLVVHNLQRHPIVTVMDAASRLIYPDVTYLDQNIVQLNFDIPMTGTAYLN